MKNLFFTLSFLFIFCIAINAQEVISSSGAFFENSGGSISWTIGEPMTETFTGSTIILTQGFHQSNLTGTSIFELEDLNITVKIAPNPTSDFITLYIDKYKSLNYQLYDFNGKLIMQSDIFAEETEISFISLAYAAYFLKISKGNQIIKTFQIIKQ